MVRTLTRSAGWVTACLLAVPLVVVVVPETSPQARAGVSGGVVTGPLVQAISGRPVLDANSGAIINRFGAAYVTAHCGTRVYTARRTDPGYQIKVQKSPAWGPNPFERYTVRIPAGAKPTPCPDHWLIIRDPAQGRQFDIWYEKAWNGDYRRAMFGAVYALPSSMNKPLRGAGSGSNISTAACAIREEELANGYIDHAICVAGNFIMPREYRSPATKTDGSYTGPGVKVREGTRLQLDPAVNVAALPGLSGAERTIGRALQKFGAVVIDQAGGNGAIMSLEYSALRFFPRDYYRLKLPWNRMRVLRTWNGN